ncbi:hypothetical protein [Micromonospora coxensis]|uniref:DUF11 domain-containing protein n=1 Tax=Micromonospora coxensis TaxID=356852 RepID=A0A1C5ID91_9ACTN|nr:hypothetical protein [Micromonospora coxensis]SCG55999.1 hypothetical protein GA0070614_2583 [Micromonospora coxensis]
MPERETSLLVEEFDRYRRTLLTEIVAPGPAAVRRTVRLRHRNRLIAAATTALALLTGPAVGYAALHEPAPRPGPVDPTPSVTPSPTPTGSAGPAPTPSASSTSPTPTPPDGRISRSQLLGTPVTLPAWRAGPGCPTTGARLTGDGREGTNHLLAVDHGDVDSDGAAETVALVRCALGTGGPQQVVVFDRDADGRVVTVGRVVASTIDTPQWLIAMEVRDDGVVRVQVGDIHPGGGWPGDWSQRQWRGYRWDGDSFGQVSGPTAFGPNPHRADIAVTATDLVLADGPDGSRTGSVTVVVRNTGDVPVPYVALRLDLPAALRPDGDGWAACRNDPDTTGRPVTCDLGRLDVGKERRLTLGFRAAAGAGVGAGTAEVDVRPMDEGFDFLPDVDPGNNTVRIDYR